MALLLIFDCRVPIWRQAIEFGATIHTDFSPLLTHVVTAKVRLQVSMSTCTDEDV